MNRSAAILLLLFVPLAGAQAPAIPAASPADIAVVREFLAVTGAEQQYEQMTTAMMENLREPFRRGFEEALKSKQLDTAKRERAQAIAQRHFEDLQRDFDAEKSKLMPYDRLVTEVYGPLYLKFMTRAEIAEATAFFKSPTGRKLSGAMPQVMQNAGQVQSQRYMPELVRSMNRQLSLRLKRMTDELNKL
jgi:hypothetical protein